MFNVAVINLKDIIKYFVILIIILVSLFLISKYCNSFKNLDSTILTSENGVIENDINQKQENEDPGNEGLFDYDFTGCIDTTSTFVSSINKSNTSNINKTEEKNLYEEILKSQIGEIEDFIPDKKEETEDTAGEGGNVEIVANAQNNTNDNNQLELAGTNLSTEVVTQNPLQLNFNSQYGNVKIKNGTSFELTNEILNPNIKIDNKNIVLFHTHTCESYTSSDKFPYTPTGNFRTTDLNFTVARVGDELENYLKKYGHNVIHNKKYHDYPSYNGSYTNSLATVEEIIKQTPSDIIFDIHRDAIGSRSDYAPCVKIGDDVCAQIMFVVGTNEGGLWHPNWQQNLKFAVKVQQKAEELYPGLFKPIMLTKYRYNQHTGKFASIIEVGATGNTLEQCNNSMKYFSKVLDEVLK